jgi:hypothetical protein
MLLKVVTAEVIGASAATAAMNVLENIMTGVAGKNTPGFVND